MMLSYLKKAVQLVLPWGSEPSVDGTYLNADEDGGFEDELTILNNLKKLNLEITDAAETLTSNDQILGQSDPVQYEVETYKCIHKTGKVTFLCKDYGLIDDVIYFEPSQVSVNINLKVDDEVLYSAFQARENETERIYKVYSVKSEDGEPDFDLPDLEKPEEISALSRVVTGRVTRRRKREVYIESADIWCNLDKIKASYIPVEGDWVELQAAVAVNKDNENLSGDVLEVRSLKPLLKKTGLGRVTLWSEKGKEGAIENSIYFTIVACKEGFVPTLGDEVTYEAVESDQERYRWRALKVMKSYVEPVDSVLPQMEDLEEIDYSKENMMAVMKDKHGIIVRPAVCRVEVALNKVKTVKIEVCNKGKSEKLVIRSNFLNKNTQIKLVSPKESVVPIQPKQTVLFTFECEGKTLGLVVDMFFLHFSNFVIGKRFEIHVTGSKEMNELLECKFGTEFRFFSEKQYTKGSTNFDFALYGPKPWKPPRFAAKESKAVFDIPRLLWEIAGEGTQKIKSTNLVLQYAPYLSEDMSFIRYAERFHTLLYLEEIDVRINFKNFDLNETFLRRHDEYFVVEVPGLIEKRPALVVGDKIVVTQAWSEGDKTQHIGYIHCVRDKEIFVKFHQSFHQTYDGSECDISFQPNISVFLKAHEAVNRAVKVLGEQWLFPSAVNEKPPKIHFEVPEGEGPLLQEVLEAPDSSATDHRNLPDSGRKTLNWVNDQLNERQKLAVVKVLRGQGRPLPYIIFGPPGTGKTITLVEIVIQIYRLIPDSRILVTTPSNSSANLLCERLIQAGNFKPGQLVRLVALYRIFEGLVPPELIPYTSYYLGKENGRRIIENSFYTNLDGAWNEYTGRHRITVGTCTTVSILHYHGFPPGHFTHILVDEAGQTSEPEVLLSATFQNAPNSQVVLTGDPQQLGPLVCSKVALKYGLGTSLMQRLISRFPYARDFDSFPNTSGFDPRFITQLNVNYRSIPEILSLSSQMFYNSDLIPTISQTNSKEAEIVKKFNFLGDGRTTPCALIFYGIIGQNFQEVDSPSWFNPHEIWQVVFFVRKLYSLGLTNDDIGIVTPYAKQVQKLRNILPRLQLAVPKIGSVEEFQGQERLVIIVSTVRSSPKLIHSDLAFYLGFVASPRRLNVALTRARALLIIVGNPLLLSYDPYWCNVIRYCIHNKSYVGCHPQVFGDINGCQNSEEISEFSMSSEPLPEFSITN